MRLVIIGTLLAVGLLGCATTEPDRQTKLLAMASDEAQQITASSYMKPVDFHSVFQEQK